MASLPPGAQIQPIDSLTPFLSGKWWIKARVTDKSDLRTWNKPNSAGKLFSFTLVDQTSAIRATMFNEAVDMFFPMLTAGQVYYLSGGQLKSANKKFSNVNNEYEISFDKNAQIVPARADADTFAIPVQRYNFVPVQVLKNREEGTMVDILGVVTQIGDLGSVVQKASGKELTKRTVKVADSTAAVDVTLWGDTAKAWNMPVGTVVAFRSLRIGSFDGVSLSSTMQSTFDQNPQIPDTKRLSEWFVSTGGSDVVSLSHTGVRAEGGDSETYKGRKFFDDAAREKLGRGPKGDYVDIRCTPVFMKTEAQWYDACPTCNKKVTAVGAAADQFKCEKCDRMVTPVARYMMSMQASDGVTQQWLTLFNEAAQEFLGMPANELKRRCEADSGFITKLAHARMHRPFLMRMRVKEERQSVDADNQLRFTVMKVTDFLGHDESPLAAGGAEAAAGCRPAKGDIKQECQHILDCINSY